MGRLCKSIAIEKIIFSCLVVAIVTYMMFYAIGVSIMLREGPEHTSIIPMIDQTVSRPYIYRTLLPTLSQIITQVTPETVQQYVGQIALSIAELPIIQEFMIRAKWTEYNPILSNPPYLYPTTIILLLMYLSFLLYAFMLHRTFLLCFPDRKYAAMWSTVLGLIVLLPFITHVFKVYDPPTLAFSILCLYFMVGQQWVPYLIVFTLSCINKETTLLQAFFFAMAFFNKMPRRKYLELLLMQLIIFASIKLAINYIYADSPGLMVKYRHVWVVAVESRRIVGWNILWVVFTLWLITAHWRELPATLKHSLWVFFGCTLVYYILGAPGEYRVFFDAFPGMTLMAGYSLFRQFDLPKEKT